MPPLSELQRDFAAALFEGAPGAILFAPGPIAPEAALAVHRSTVLGALTGALRHVFPTVHRLVGENYFDQSAAAFALAALPVRACLSSYGEDFPQYLGRQLPANLSYIAEVARFDLALDRALQQSQAGCCFDLEAGVSLRMPAHLQVLMLAAPADLIRDAIDDEAALAALDIARPRHLLVWRSGGQAMVRAVSAASAEFVRTLYAQDAAEPAFAAALAHGSEEQVLAALQAEIFAAPFTDVISPPKDNANDR